MTTDRTRLNPPPAAPGGDLGRRLTARRVQLGLTREETAGRAGMATSYLAHLEQHPGVTPGQSTLHALATVLRTTVAGLTGADADLPPGPGKAGHAPRFTELSRTECGDLLSSHGVGRLAITTEHGPVIVPVNYSVIDGTIVFRTARDATPALAAGAPVAFEVDRIDDAFAEGWSVLARGHGRRVSDPVEANLLAARAYSLPWAGGGRDTWVRIEPYEVTGRRIEV
ncbi:pyridoxamine 5'-phosphate oxidase family protein [Streptomyces sp. NPDC008150]|uniref:helix-turn-helix domain-containing protein n=1 Tax=Streptomyces sp. NPDC008150 TaxID=3364816 RepID=UPI0036ECFE65